MEEVGLRHPHKYHGGGLGPSKGLRAKCVLSPLARGGRLGAPVSLAAGGATGVPISSPTLIQAAADTGFHLERSGSGLRVAVGGGLSLSPVHRHEAVAWVRGWAESWLSQSRLPKSPWPHGEAVSMAGLASFRLYPAAGRTERAPRPSLE